jgi:hypothetical protein
LARIDLKTINIASETEPLPYAGIRPEEYHSFRMQTARDIIALREATAEQAARSIQSSERPAPRETDEVTQADA